MFQGKRAGSTRAAKEKAPASPAVDVVAGAVVPDAAVVVGRIAGEVARVGARVGALAVSVHPCPGNVADPGAKDAAFVSIDGDPHGRWCVQLTRAQLAALCRAVLSEIG